MENKTQSWVKTFKTQTNSERLTTKARAFDLQDLPEDCPRLEAQEENKREILG